MEYGAALVNSSRVTGSCRHGVVPNLEESAVGIGIGKLQHDTRGTGVLHVSFRVSKLNAYFMDVFMMQHLTH